MSRAAVAALSSVEDRVLFMAVAGAAQFAGSALMPGVGSLLANLPTSGPLNAFTAPGACACGGASSSRSSSQRLGVLPAFLCLVLDVGIMAWLAWRIPPTAIQGTLGDDRFFGVWSAVGDDTVVVIAGATKAKAEKAGGGDASAPAAPSSLAAASPTVVKVGVAVFIALNFTARGVLSVVVAAGSPLLLSAVNDTDLDPVQVLPCCCVGEAWSLWTHRVLSVQDTGEMFLALGVVGLLV